MTRRARLATFLGLALVITGATLAFVLVEAQHRGGGQAVSRTPGWMRTVGQQRHLLFRHTRVDDVYGQLAALPLDDPTGSRVLSGQSCDRLDGAGGRILCLTSRRGLASAFEALVLEPDGTMLDRWPLPGVPDRARLSSSGRLAATTVFVTGHSYAGVGFSTATVVREVGGKSYGNLEEFRLQVEGREVRAVDRNIWGVTFGADERTFYATAATGGGTWLVKGDLDERTLTSVRRNAECPSLSPDGARVAYKKRMAEDGPTPWAVAVLDLDTGRETVIRSTRGLDDQVEWLDDDTLLYARPRAEDTAVTDVWAVAARAEATPTVYVRGAWSPAVVP